MKRDQSYKFRMMIGPSWASFLVPQTLISNPVTQRLNSDVNNTESARFPDILTSRLIPIPYLLPVK